mgnify:CR=1 FL=1
MPDITIDGQPWKSFPEDTPDEQIMSEYRQELQSRAGRAIAAGQRRDQARSQQGFLGETGIRLPALPSAGVEGFEGQGEIGEGEVPYGMVKMVAPTVGAILGGPAGAAAGAGVNVLARRLTTPEAERPPVTSELGEMGKEGLITALFPKIVSKGISSGGKILGKIMPGSWRAQQAVATEGMERLGEKIAAETPGVAGGKISQFMRDPQAAAIRIPLRNTAGKAQDLIEEGQELAQLGQFFRDQGLEKVAAAVENISTGLTGAVKTISGKEAQLILHHFRELSEEAPKALRPMMKAIGGAVKRDVEVLAETSPTAQRLLDIRKGYARAITKEKIGDLARTGGVSAAPESARVAEQTIVSPGKVLDILKRGGKGEAGDLAQRFAKLEPAEQQAITVELNRLATHARPTGESWGRYAHPFAWFLGGSALGGATGGYQGTLAGGLAGIAVERAIERLVSKPGGVKMVRRLIENQIGKGKFATKFAPPLSAALGTTIEE